MARDGILERVLGAGAGYARMNAAVVGDMSCSSASRTNPVRPAKSILPKIDLRKRLGPEPDVDEAYELVTGTMQRALDKLDDERSLPVVG